MPWVGGLLPQCRACAKGCFFLFLFFLLLLMSQITSARCGWPNGNCRSASPWTATLLLSGALDGETSKALGGFGFPSGIYQSVLRHHWWQLANTKVLGRTDQKFRCNFIQNPLNPLVALVFLYHQHLLIPSFFFFFFVCVCVLLELLRVQITCSISAHALRTTKWYCFVDIVSEPAHPPRPRPP